MWPFTSRRIFGNRWWALAFGAVVCWQVAELFGPPVSAGPDAAAIANGGDVGIDESLMLETGNSLNTLREDSD
jgi:hypothetical protein